MQQPEPPPPCPLCGVDSMPRIEPNPMRDAEDLNCPNCGRHSVSAPAMEVLRELERDPLKRAAVAHAVRKRPAGDLITTYQVADMARLCTLPPAEERVDNLVLFLGETVQPGASVDLHPRHLQAVVGAATTEQTKWVFDQAVKLGLIDGNELAAPSRAAGIPIEWRSPAALSVGGWKRYSELLRLGVKSRHAFMAMDFKNAELGAFFTDHLQPAATDTGFELRTTQHEGKTPELIDNRMRVEIRTSRFVVCDLTDGNQGAYWEAGFAEGIGRPVIYLCRHNVLRSDDRRIKPHFDIAHHPIIAWDAANPGPAVAELKNMIRATLPAEARMVDMPASATNR